MKKNLYLFISLALAMIITFSCKENELSSSDVPNITRGGDVFHTSINPFSDETKTFLNAAVKLCWNTGDEISVFNGKTARQKYAYLGVDGAFSGTITCQNKANGGTAISKIVAGYPYSSVSGISSAGELAVNYPREQTYVSGSFGRGSNIMVAVSDIASTELHFKNICGYLRLSLTGDKTITAIRLKGNSDEKISGNLSIAALSDGYPVTMGADATKEIVLNCPEGVLLSSDPTLFYIALPPTTFTAGITVDIYDSEGKYMTKSTSNSLSIAANHIKPLDQLAYASTGGTAAGYVSSEIFGAYGTASTSYYVYTKGNDQIYVSTLSDGSAIN